MQTCRRGASSCSATRSSRLAALPGARVITQLLPLCSLVVAFIILLIQLQRIKYGVSYFQGSPIPSCTIHFIPSSRFVEICSRTLINQVETVGVPYLTTKRPIFSTKKNFSPRYEEKKKSSTGSLVFCVQRQWSLFHLGAAFNEINPPLTVTRDESRRQSQEEFRESSSEPHLPTHSPHLNPSQPPVLVLLRDGRGVGRAASAAVD